MDYLKTQATFDTRHRTKTNKKIKHNTENKIDEQHEQGVNPGAREE